MQTNFIYSYKMKFLIICAALFFSVEASNLPSYISKCCVTDPDAEKCYLSQAKLIIPLILRGDKRYNLINLVPYMEAQRTLYNCEEGKFILHTLRVWGLDSINVLSLNFNFDTGKYTAKYHFDILNFEFTYNIHIKDTPLVGFGRGNIKLPNVNITHTSDIAEDKDGYVYFLNAAVKCASANVVYNLENLCESAEQYFQDNIEQFNKMFQPNIYETLKVVLTSPFIALSELIKLKTGIGFGEACKECL